MDKTKVIPSMFHRRLVLLLAAFFVVVIVLSGQMFRLAVVEGAERRATAEAKLDRRTFLPTHRGRILDRHGRVLAMDRASFDLAVNYSVITGDWVRTRARQQARREMGGSRWSSIRPDEREAAVRRHLPHFEHERNRLWSEICRLGGMSPQQLQQRLDEIKAHVQSTAATHWERQWLREQSEYGISEAEFRPETVREQRQAHVVMPRISDELAFAFRKLDQDMPGMIEVQDSMRREYPWLNAEVSLSRGSLPKPIRSDQSQTIRVSGVADHILGSMRDQVWADDVKRRPFRNSMTGAIDLGWYQPGDSVGARGLERVFEDHLRGLRGELRERRDSDEKIRTEPRPGGDLLLTLDIALQARVQAVLSAEFGLARVQGWQKNTGLPIGMPLNSAAVVVEVDTGEIVAMVSMPTMAMGLAMNDQQRQINQPLFNRATEAVYPPGSIIKPFVFAAAVKEGLHRLDHAITCNGHYFSDNKDRARCWIYRERFGFNTHGPLRIEEALARSCNIFFYTLGDRLGIERLIKWFRNFGLGSALDVGLLSIEMDAQGSVRKIGESDGSLPSEDRVRSLRQSGQLKFSEVIMGIGQGPMTWTPVQAANAYATLARGGTIRDATLLMHDPRGRRARRCDDLQLSSASVSAALEGLRQSVMERYGTGHHISYDDGSEEPILNADGVQVWAKTGTAQAPSLRLRDTNRDGIIDGKDEGIAGLDHSWFVGLVGPRQSHRPLYAVAVIVEYGGSGGRTAGPIANQIIRALQAEGYLPGDANAAPAGVRRSSSPPAPEPIDEDED